MRCGNGYFAAQLLCPLLKMSDEIATPVCAPVRNDRCVVIDIKAHRLQRKGQLMRFFVYDGVSPFGFRVLYG